MLLTLQLSLQLDDVLKVLEAVPDSGKERKKGRKVCYGCSSQLLCCEKRGMVFTT